MDIKKNIELAPYTTFHIGGPADFFVKTLSADDLTLAITWAIGKGMQYFVLGQGANILISDRGFRGLVIKNEADNVSIPPSLRAERGNPEEIASSSASWRTPRNDESVLVTAESGVTIAELIEKTASQGLSGLEHFAGIPSSLGGALWQNLHFLSPDRSSTMFIADVLVSAHILRFAEYELEPIKEETVDREYFKFGYDYSILHDTHDVVLSATLQLQPKDPQEIRKVIEENLKWRKEKQPTDAVKKSAGSVFKKIEGHGAGRLIEQAGLKGKTIGGAQISEDHANFILNTGNATAKDVRDLILLAQTEVKKATGLHLEPEISFVGEF